MDRGFWGKIKKPIFVLAPMANVTDEAFRRLFAKYGKPDVMWTEFVSVEGLLSVGREKLLPDLWKSRKEKPVVAQIFGGKPEQFEIVARQLAQMGFDGIDINMGCPDRGIEKSGGGAAMMKNPKLAQEVVLATRRGAGDVPVSVKTRLGYSKNEMTEWVKYLLEVEPAVITMHLRTRKEMSLVPARWDQMSKLVELVAREIPKVGERPLLLGNGDISSMEEARERVKETGADGVMIGRGAFGNPFFFNEKKKMEDLSIKKRLAVMMEHAKLFEKLFKDIKNFDVMKKHFKAYVNGFDGAKELRIKLMEAENAKEAGERVRNFLN